MSSPEFYRTIDFYPTFGDKCQLCMKCISTCPLGVIYVADDKPRMLIGKRHLCRNCRKCISVCAYDAITIEAELGGKMAGHLKKEYFS